jgi:DNA-binding CsgD family transcriptional regulator
VNASRWSERLIGRSAELDFLRERLDGARRGAGRLVLCAGEAGIGKSRLAQEFAGVALAGDATVAWGRCVETDGAPVYWPWRQVLRSLGVEPDGLLARDVETSEDRFRMFDDLTWTLCEIARRGVLVVVLEDVHRSDEASLLVLRHLADQLVDAPLLVLATFRDVEPGSVMPGVLPELVRAPGTSRLDLRRFDLTEVEEQLRATVGDVGAARSVLELTGGNPLFVREVARVLAEGGWQPDRPPRSVLDIVMARLDRASESCRVLVQCAAVAGRYVDLGVVAEALGVPVADCLPDFDEAVALGLLEPTGDAWRYRFVHALTRDAVEASLGGAERAGLHRSVAGAIEARFAGDLTEHLADLARHWSVLAPHGEAATARAWTLRAAAEAADRLAYEEAVRLYRAALALSAPWSAADRAGTHIALGRAANLAGDVRASLEAAAVAAESARDAGGVELEAEAALILDAVPELEVNAVVKQLCERALTSLVGPGDAALRARLLARLSNVAFYDGDQPEVQRLSTHALGLARAAGDDHALVGALRARHEACPGPSGREERLLIGSEMIALAGRTSSPRTAMWGALWLIEALVETGRLARAFEELAALRVAADRVGGPVSAWHLDRVTACVAQAQGRYAEAITPARRGFERMRPVEPAPATGAFFGLLGAMSRHVGLLDDAVPFLAPFDPVPRFRTMQRLNRALLLLAAERPDDAAASFHQAGPVDSWSVPVFFDIPAHVYGVLITTDLGMTGELPPLLERLERFRGEYAVGTGVYSLGPVELALGVGAVASGRLDDAVGDLTTAAAQAARAGATGHLAEARYHLADALRARGNPGDRDAALRAARDAAGLARDLGMTAYTDRSAALVERLEGDTRTVLSAREDQIAALVAEGLTNRQIAERLVISERTAQNHVQHILTKLGFSSRSQITAWRLSAKAWTQPARLRHLGRELQG